jgi:phosphoenolpyruvate carboxykinase (GTP)
LIAIEGGSLMNSKGLNLLKTKCSGKGLQKLLALNNQALLRFITYYVELCNPDSVYICNDSEEDRQYISNKALETGEEKKLAIEGHTIHYDGFYDQGRDKEQTRYLLPKGIDLGESLNSIDKETGMAELHGFFKDIMVGKEVFVLFFCLGPTNSIFSIPCVQITDSSYVAHSEYILYRKGYEQFRRIGDSAQFFKFVHSAGELENMVSKNVDKKRIYIDLEDKTVYTTNSQYAGNTVGLKKLALRLAIHKAAQEDWLSEHMLIMGVHGPGGRKSYFTGAFPSACGKTSTAMLPGETIVGDDIAYLRKRDGKIYAANVESGIFGIIKDVNLKDDPVIWKALTEPGEVIFSNVLTTEDGKAYWLGDKQKTPEKGFNYSGQWYKGKKDDKGNEIPHAHGNARYTLRLDSLRNLDSELDNPDGVELKGIIYGGRDSSVWPPVQQAFDWTHGVITIGAALESETTSATLGQEGVRQFNPMSNLDFVAIPLSDYINEYLKFVDGLDTVPPIFGVNYFQKDKNGNYLTAMNAKRVWVKWMDLRVNGDAGALKTPTGYIPLYDDLKRLFKEVLDEDYSSEAYLEQFSLKVAENLKKIERIKQIYSTKVENTPEILFKVLDEQKQRLEAVKASYGELIAPASFPQVGPVSGRFQLLR